MDKILIVDAFVSDERFMAGLMTQLAQPVHGRGTSSLQKRRQTALKSLTLYIC